VWQLLFELDRMQIGEKEREIDERVRREVKRGVRGRNEREEGKSKNEREKVEGERGRKSEKEEG
jgi:hypothetical protein